MHTATPANRKSRPLKGAGLIRSLPLGRKFHPILGWLNGTSGLVELPFGPGRIIYPASWTKPSATLLVAGENIIPEFELIAPILRELKSGTVVDVGANLGFFPLLMRRETTLPIAGFEPQPFLHELSQLSVALNGLRDIELHRLACGDARGEVLFQTGPNGNVVSASPDSVIAADADPAADLDSAAYRTHKTRPLIPVPVVTLDEQLAGTKVALMKVDCEGYELRVLRGAMNILKRDRPYLLVEVHPKFLPEFGGSVRDVVDLLAPLYDLEPWDFSPDRGRIKFLRSLSRYAPDRGQRFDSLEAMIKAAETEPRPTQLYLLCRPRR